MPIVLIAKEKADYEAWVAEQKALAEAKIIEAKRVMAKDELIAKGEAIYTNKCSSCHMPDGAGLPGAFPAISGSAIVNGDIEAQIEIMMNGKGMMPAFGTMLNPVEFASVATFIRNGLGNSVGDSVQPSVIQKKQSALAVVEDEDDE